MLQVMKVNLSKFKIGNKEFEFILNDPILKKEGPVT